MQYKTYLERTSRVKKSCSGQSTEYSRAILCHPSSANSELAFPWEERSGVFDF
jgi:hypothetical protein